MKKLVTLFAILMVAMGALIAPVAAAPTSELNALASYFPATTGVLVSLRTDDAYIKEIDDLFAKVAAQIPGMETPDRIADQLDKAIKDGLGSGDFDSEVRSWLGDVASVGLMSFEGMMGQGSGSDAPPPHFLLATQVKDRAAAESFWETVLSKSETANYAKSTKGDFTVFMSKSEDNPGIIAISDDVLFVAVYEEDIPFEGQKAALSDEATFTDSLALLPEPDYNITIYTNLKDVFKEVMATMSDQSNMSDSDAAMFKSMEPLFENFPPEVVGFTVLDERSMTVDIALPYGDLLKTYTAAGMSTATPVALDPAFAANLLSGSPLVIHSTNLGATLLSLLENLKVQAGMMGASTGMNAEEIEKGIGQVNALIKIVTGKDLVEDILPAMEGDYALYITLNPALSDLSSQADLMKQLPVDFGFVTEMNDATIAPAIIEGLTKSLKDAEEFKLTTESIGGVDALVITGVSAGMPFPIELVLASNDNLVFFGTRRAAEAALTGDGGLDSDASFVEASKYFVPSPSVIAYFGSAGLKPLTKLMEMMGSKRDGEQFAAFLNLVSSASISSSYDADNGYARLVWTLPE